jgi:hypothetical protein
MSGLASHISSNDTFLFNRRSDYSGDGDDDDSNNSNNITLLLINNNICIAETC